MLNHWENFSLENIKEEIDGVMYYEIWKPVYNPTYSNLYWVSSFGRLKSISRNIILRQQNSVGYLKIRLCNNGENKTYLSHILIGRTFIPNPLNLPEINHKKGLRRDNRIWELEWSTSSDNIKHAFEIGLSKKGEDHGISKLTNEQVLEIFNSKERREELCEKYGVSITTVKSIKLGKTWGQVTGKIYSRAMNKSHGGLTDKDVIDIYESTERPGVLMKKYNISNVSINNIKTGFRWSYLTKDFVRGYWQPNKR